MNVTVTAELGPQELYLSAPECTVELQTARTLEEERGLPRGRHLRLLDTTKTCFISHDLNWCNGRLWGPRKPYSQT